MAKEYCEDTNPRVAIIVGYFNGNSYLNEQIRSILNQSHKSIQIVIFDDCSDDPVDEDALNLTKDEQKIVHIVVRDRNLGFSSNFLQALSHFEEEFDYYAFSDQDDIWDQFKIEAALSQLSTIPHTTPSLYCGRTQIADEACEEVLGLSPLFNKTPSFANALVQSIAGGNTMVFNNSAKQLIRKSIEGKKVVSHDWWCYLVVAGVGGQVIYDPNSYLKYRQHSANVVGSNNGWTARFKRVKGVIEGRFRNWNNINIRALSTNAKFLTSDNLLRLDNFKLAQKSGFFKRLVLFKRSGIYRQTFLGNLGLLFGILINRV